MNFLNNFFQYIVIVTVTNCPVYPILFLVCLITKPQLCHICSQLEEITKWIDEGSPVDIIYLNFQKAFDKVPHQRLLLKLKAHGIGDGIKKANYTSV